MKTVVHKSTIPADQMFVVRELRDKYFDPTWHAHSEFQLFVVLEGTGTRFIGDNIKTFKSGELILTGPHLPHLWRSDEAYFSKVALLSIHGIVLYLNEHFLGEQALLKEELVMVKKLLAKAKKGIEFFGESKEQAIKLLKAIIPLKGLDRVIVLLQLLQVLATTKDYQFISHSDYGDRVKPEEADRTNIVYAYVLKNFRRKIILQEVAALVHMTPTSFSRYFTRNSNKNFSAFVAEVRIRQACKLLMATEEPIEAICYDCGFNTLSNFNKQFRELMADNPSSYRKKFLAL